MKERPPAPAAAGRLRPFGRQGGEEDAEPGEEERPTEPCDDHRRCVSHKPAPDAKGWRPMDGWSPRGHLKRAEPAGQDTMRALLTFLLVAAMLGVLVILAIGIINLVRGGAGRDPHRQNALMRWRILLQAVAIGLFLLILTFFRR